MSKLPQAKQAIVQKLTQSMQFRVLAAASAVMIVFSVLAVVLLVKVFSYTVEMGVKSRLEASLYGVMGIADVLDESLWLPSALPEARFNQLTSGLYAWVQSAQGRKMDQSNVKRPGHQAPVPGEVLTTVIWRSESSIGKQLPEMRYIPSGEFSWQSLTMGETPVWVLSFSSTWSLGDEQTGYYQFSLAQAKAPFQDQVASFQRQLIASFATLAVLLSCIQWFLLRRGLRPLSVLTGQLGDIEAGERAAVAGRFPLELQPMVKNLNATLQSERQQRERYRNTLADLAHSLKTPLTVIKDTLSSESERSPQREEATIMLEQVQRMDSIVQYQLKRSVAQNGDALTQRTDFMPILEKILSAMEKVYRGRNITAEVFNPEAAAGVQVLMEEADVFEILGNLVDNAFKYCTQRISIFFERDAEFFLVRIEDDGPGIAHTQRASVLARGKRLDEQGIAGQGIGLAVVADICRVYQVPLTISDSSSLGGAQIRLKFSYFQKAQR